MSNTCDVDDCGAIFDSIFSLFHLLASALAENNVSGLLYTLSKGVNTLASTKPVNGEPMCCSEDAGRRENIAATSSLLLFCNNI